MCSLRFYPIIQVDQAQMKRVLGMIEKGKAEGARLICGGNRIGTTGAFIEPTIFADVTDDMTIAKEEVIKTNSF